MNNAMPQHIRIGTRASKLAMVQTALVEQILLAAHPDLHIEVVPVTTKGDAVQNRPLRDIGETGLFVAAIEATLRRGQIDLAVHSAKDLPSMVPDDMALAAFPLRADVCDVLISRNGESLADLPQRARVGTSSARRICQLRHLRPDLKIVDLRGNVDTRLHKLRDGEFDAIVLAKAGLDRLGLTDQITELLEPESMLPAVAQGALALEARKDDATTIALLAPLDDRKTRLGVLAERAFLARVGGGCHAPVAAYTDMADGMLNLIGLIGAFDGRVVRGTLSGAVGVDEERAAALGEHLADELLAAGGAELLAEGAINAQE